MEVRVNPDRIVLKPESDLATLILVNEGRDKYLEIEMGMMEMQHILIAVNHIKLPRPLIHDLVIDILMNKLGISINKVVISRIYLGFHCADIHMESLTGEEIIQDCRPSDGISLALKVDCYIFAEDYLLTSFDNGGPEKDTGQNPEEDFDIEDDPILSRIIEKDKPEDQK